MICPQRGALGKYLYSAWEGVTAFATKWNGFLPRVVVIITGEALGAAVAETIVPHALTAADRTFEKTIPLYREIPLIATTVALPLIVIARAGKASKVALSLLVLTIPLTLSLVSLKDLEDSTCQVAGALIHYLAGMFASITGGFLALNFASIKLGHTPEEFSGYRSKMVWHALTGQIFEACINPANMIIFKILRFTTRSLIQTAAYNKIELWRAFKLSVRKEKTYGVISPILTKALYDRFQSIERKELANTIVTAILPFFLKGYASLLSTQLVEPLVRKKLETLQKESATMINALSRSLIEYTSILQTSDIHKATSTLFNLVSMGASKETIDAANESLKKLLTEAITLKSPPLSYPIEKIVKTFLGGEEGEKNATTLSKLISTELDKLGIFLIGHPVYPESHFKSIESIILAHLEPFLTFIISRALTLDSTNDPLSPIEEIKLTSIIHHVLFSTIIEPLLPLCLVSGIKRTLDLSLKTTVGTIHKLQGFNPSIQLFEPVKLIENYDNLAPLLGSDKAKKRPALPIIDDNYFHRSPSPPIDLSDYFEVPQSPSHSNDRDVRGEQ